MYFVVSFIIVFFIPAVQGTCSNYKTCHSCASSKSWNFISSCRWCEETQSCHSLASSDNQCISCSDSSISKICSVTDAAQCGVYISKRWNFNPYEAYNATIYSAIAYTDDPVRCVNTLFPGRQLEIVEVIGRKCDYFDYNECFAVVAVSHEMKTIILTYRGTTNTKQLLEEFVSVLEKSKVARVSGGNVQEYFSNVNDQLYPCVRSSMSDLVSKYPTYNVSITGHSLGGAIASIASAELSYDNIVEKGKIILYTFGMPRTGDKVYAKHHDSLVPNSWRVVHFRDIVTKLPSRSPFPSSPYHHQREIFYGKTMTPTTDYIECFEYEDDKCGNSVSASIYTVEYHRKYYGIPVGSHCDERMHRRRKRATEDSALGHLFNRDVCKRIKARDLPTSSVTIKFN